MTAPWLDNLGNRNPQLLRELRSRFQLRSVNVTIALTIIAQILLVLLFVANLPRADFPYSSFCLGRRSATCVVDWPRWWRQIFVVITNFMPYVLYLPAAFLLTNNMAQEAQSGTLNFLRLSPRSSATILFGKLLGVPSLIYLAWLLLLPLTTFAAVMGGIPLGFLLSFYLTLLFWGSCLLLLVLVSALGVGAQLRLNNTNGTPGVALGLVVTLIVIPMIRYWNSVTVWRDWELNGFSQFGLPNINWFQFAINGHPIVAHGFLFLNLAFVGYCLWRIAQRMFRRPTATALSKRQSYAIVAYIVLLVMGFVVHFNEPQQWERSAFGLLAVLASLAIYLMLICTGMLSTPRQILFDWLRGRREAALTARSQNLSPGKRRQLQIKEWLFGEKSPGFTAVWINWLIVYAALSLLLIWTGRFTAYAILGLVLTTLLVANYSLLAQLMLLLETPKRYVWALGSLLVAIILPSIAIFIPVLNLVAPYLSPFLWLPLDSLVQSRQFLTTNSALMFLGALASLTILSVLLMLQGLILRSRLKQLGRGL